MSQSPQPVAPDLFAAERKLDEFAGYALFGGAMLSFILVCAGLVAMALHPSQATLAPMPIAMALRSAFRKESDGLVSLGVLVLMATPLLRVVIATVGFAVLKWWRFAAVSAVVLALLLLSFLVAA